MTTAALKNIDRRVRDAVSEQLAWDPQLDASAIGVVARNGVVTLTGFVDTYAGKLAAERAAKRVPGVLGVANDVTVRQALDVTDVDIANDAVAALTLLTSVPHGVQVAVHSGCVTLTGRVTWWYQKQEAEGAMRHIHGVRHVFNHIVVSPETAVRDVRHRIVKALHQNADIDARHISAAVVDETVTLSGVVRSWLERESAERAAASAPGIAHVINNIILYGIRIHSAGRTNCADGIDVQHISGGRHESLRIDDEARRNDFADAHGR